MIATNQLASNFTFKVSIPENVLVQELNGEVVLLNMENESYYSLNTVGSRIWKLLTEQGDVKAAMQRFLQIYDVDETQQAHITILINELLNTGLLQKTEEHKVGEMKKEPTEIHSDNRLPYEHPRLTKHGTIHDITLTSPSGGGNFDSVSGNYDMS